MPKLLRYPSNKLQVETDLQLRSLTVPCLRIGLIRPLVYIAFHKHDIIEFVLSRTVIVRTHLHIRRLNQRPFLVYLNVFFGMKLLILYHVLNISLLYHSRCL